MLTDARGDPQRIVTAVYLALDGQTVRSLEIYKLRHIQISVGLDSLGVLEWQQVNYEEGFLQEG